MPLEAPIELEHDKTVHRLHHELQNCLNVISMGTEILATSRDDDEAFSEYFELVQEHRREASRLIEEFLNHQCQACE